MTTSPLRVKYVQVFHARNGFQSGGILSVDWHSPLPRELTKPYRKRKNGRNQERAQNTKDQGPRTRRSPFNRLVSHDHFGQALNASGLICTAFLSKALFEI
jgi:hypothetical protein